MTEAIAETRGVGGRFSNDLTASQKPRILWRDAELSSVIGAVATKDSLLVCDPHNSALLTDVQCRKEVVDDCRIETITRISADSSYEDIIAVGGCTALDVGRACADGRAVTVVPTILSSSCIGSSTSVIEVQGQFRCTDTSQPKTTLISVPTIVENHSGFGQKWSASGLGDLLSSIGAGVEYLAQQEDWDADLVRRMPLSFAALDWLEQSKWPLETRALCELAEHLHEFSLSGHDQFAVGSEHELYYALRRKYGHSREVATHGKVVAFGSLPSVIAWCEQLNDFSLFERIQAAFERVALPVTFRDLAQIGISSEEFFSGFRSAENLLFARISRNDWLGWRLLH